MPRKYISEQQELLAITLHWSLQMPPNNAEIDGRFQGVT